MKNVSFLLKRGWRLCAIATLAVFTVGLAACSNSNDPIQSSTVAINIKNISGVTPPATGEIPITTVTETAQFMGTVAWSGNPSIFAASTIYTATITLAAKTGYALQGVAANSFTVAGATQVTHAANSGVITAEFEKTGATPPAPIDVAAIPGVTAPLTGETPVTAITETAQYTGIVTWSGNPIKFAASTIYTATITLTPKSGYTMQGIGANFFDVDLATSVSNNANSGVVTAVFPKTAAAVTGAINITSAEDMAKIGNDPAFPLNGEYVLTQNISLPANWTPIGDADNPFIGSFDGGSKSITVNGFVASSDRLDYGIFGNTNGATIQNITVPVDNTVTLDFGNITTTRRIEWTVGTIVGYMKNTELDNVSISGSGSFKVVLIASSAELTVGGVAGRVETNLGGFSKISNTSVSIPVTSDLSCAVQPANGDSTYSCAGGIVGRTMSTSKPWVVIENCSSSGTINAYGKLIVQAIAGGIGAKIENSTAIQAELDLLGTNMDIMYNSFSSVINCYSTGAITAVSENNSSTAGGIAGISNRVQVIKNSWASGNITASSLNGTAAAGGIAATNWKGSKIDSCYYKTGKVSAEGASMVRAGGIVTSNENLNELIVFNGQILNPLIIKCYSSGNIEASNGSNNTVGGIAAFNSGTITNCFSTGSETMNGPINQSSQAGGIAGANTINTNNGTVGSINQSYALGDVTVSSSGANPWDVNAGGIAGASGGIITYCAALNQKITAQNSSTSQIGSFWGSGSFEGNVSYSNMTLNEESGYYSNPSGSQGQLVAGVDLKKPASGQSIYEKAANADGSGLGWDFAKVWKFSSNAAYPYPILQWMTDIPENSNTIIGD